MAKQSNIIWIVVILGAILLLSGGLEFGGFTGFDFFGGEVDTGLVDVNKALRFHITNAYSGGPIASKTDKFQLWHIGSDKIEEDNLDTDANGLINTGGDYPSGEVMWLRFEDSNDKKWWEFTIPQMNAEDAEAATYNLIELEGFTIGTYTTDSLTLANATSISDGGTYNCSSSTDNPHLTYGLANTGSDNTGLMTSEDPVYDQDWDVEFYMTLSGTDYEKIVVYEMDWSFTLGSTHYAGVTLDAYALTKHKIGANYVSLGTQDTGFWIDTTGLTASADVTLQIYAYAYADHTYAEAHGGNFGPEAVQLAEHTILHIYN